MTPDNELNTQLQERFAKLPKVVQEAITSADVEKHLRELAEHHKLHIDQWELLENEVMLSLLGFQPAAELADNIQKHVSVDETTAISLAADISTIVFEPIRKELERGLDYPEATAIQKTGVEEMRDTILHNESAVAPTALQTPPIAPSPAVAPVMPTPEAAIAPAPIPTTPQAAIAPDATAVVAQDPVPAIPPTTPIAAVVAATPGTPAPTVTVERTETHPDYAPGAPSHERKAIAGDPYREQIA